MFTINADNWSVSVLQVSQYVPGDTSLQPRHQIHPSSARHRHLVVVSVGSMVSRIRTLQTCNVVVVLNEAETGFVPTSAQVLFLMPC